MKLLIKRNTAVRGESVAAGTIVEVPEPDCHMLISMGKAEPASGAPETISAREPEIESREPKPQESLTRKKSRA